MILLSDNNESKYLYHISDHTCCINLFKQRQHLWQATHNRDHQCFVFAIANYPPEFVCLLMGHSDRFNAVCQYLRLALVSATPSGYGMVLIYLLVHGREVVSETSHVSSPLIAPTPETQKKKKKKWGQFRFLAFY